MTRRYPSIFALFAVVLVMTLPACGPQTSGSESPSSQPSPSTGSQSTPPSPNPGSSNDGKQSKPGENSGDGESATDSDSTRQANEDDSGDAERSAEAAAAEEAGRASEVAVAAAGDAIEAKTETAQAERGEGGDGDDNDQPATPPSEEFLLDPWAEPASAAAAQAALAEAREALEALNEAIEAYESSNQSDADREALEDALKQASADLNDIVIVVVEKYASNEDGELEPLEQDSDWIATADLLDQATFDDPAIEALLNEVLRSSGVLVVLADNLENIALDADDEWLAESQREDGAVDDEFNESLEEFDQVIQSERAKVGVVVATVSSADVFSEPGTPTGQAGGVEMGEGGSGSTPEEASQASRAKGKANSSLARPERPIDGQDDDVVARQLREAAESEQDPELQAKLWEEYRRYKENQRGDD